MYRPTLYIYYRFMVSKVLYSLSVPLRITSGDKFLPAPQNWPGREERPLFIYYLDVFNVTGLGDLRWPRPRLLFSEF